jgi:hypothetical protein
MESVMLGTRDEIARMQSDFYRDWYHKILRVLVGSSIVMLGLILTIIYFVLFKPTQGYYASTTEGQIIQIIPS